MVDVRRVTLPGVGVLHSLTTADGAEVAVVAHRTGRSDLVSRPAGADDDDATTIRLDEEEAHTLAELLGGTRIVESIAELDGLPGVPIDWITVDDDDAMAGRTFGEVPAASGVALVAVVRDDHAHPSPAADFVGASRRHDRRRRSHRGDRSGVPRDPPGSGRERRRRGLMLQMMLRPRWVLALLAALGIAAGFALLGQWQLERAVQQAVVEERPTEEVRPLADVAQPDGPTEQAATGQRVEVTGTFVPGDTVIVEGRLNDGVAGYWPVAHLEVTDAAPGGLPIALGWAADLETARAAADRFDASAGGEVDPRRAASCRARRRWSPTRTPTRSRCRPWPWRSSSTCGPTTTTGPCTSPT